MSNHHIRVISDGSCDTEDWSNDAGKKYFKDLHMHIVFSSY